MTAADLIQELHHHGAAVTVDGNALSLTAPRPLPPDLLSQLRTRKTELLKELTLEHHTTSVNPHINQTRDTADARRPPTAIRQSVRRNDRRADPGITRQQGGATGDFETVEPTAPCPACGSGQWWPPAKRAMALPAL